MIPLLVALWEDNYRVYGVRKLWKAARRAGHDVGRDQVARLMGQAGIEGRRKGAKRRTTTSPIRPLSATQTWSSGSFRPSARTPCGYRT